MESQKNREMISVHATKKLLAKLPLDDAGLVKTKQPLPYGQESENRNNPLSGWHANLVTLQRRNCVLMVHDETRFPVMIKSLLKKDFANFDWYFQDAFMNTLLKVNANDEQMDAAQSLLAPCQFDTDCNRSAQGTLNRMKSDIEHLLWYDNIEVENLSAYRTGAWLAESPWNVKGRKDCVWPIKAMFELLSAGDDVDLNPNDNNNVVKLADYRNK